MIPENHLLITEIPTGTQHVVTLGQLQQGPVTVGRSAPPDEAPNSHIQIGNGSDSQGFISTYQCTLTAQPRSDTNGWDFYIKDGTERLGYHRPSSNGIWYGDTRIGMDVGFQIRLRSKITIFPKLKNKTYHCIVERPYIAEPGDDTNQDHPTLQELQDQRDLALGKARAHREEAEYNRKQLEELAKRMIFLQETFQQEKETFTERLNQQTDIMLAMSASLEKQKVSLTEQIEINRQQEQDKRALQRQARRIKLAQCALGLIVLAIALFSLNINHQIVQNILELSLAAIGLAATVMGFLKDD